MESFNNQLLRRREKRKINPLPAIDENPVKKREYRRKVL